jgi:ATP-dependent Clp protease ATP-binding subunit ClpC
MVELPLKELTDRLKKELGYTIRITPKMKDHLADVGYDEKYGARPLNRAIQKFIQDPIAERIIEGGVEEGDTLKIGFKKDDVSVEVIKPEKSETTE